MWLSKDGVVNIVHGRAPEFFVESDSHEIRAHASDQELREVLLALEAVDEDFHEEIDNLGWTVEEVASEDRELPEDGLNWFDPGLVIG